MGKTPGMVSTEELDRAIKELEKSPASDGAYHGWLYCPDKDNFLEIGGTIEDWDTGVRFVFF